MKEYQDILYRNYNNNNYYYYCKTPLTKPPYGSQDQLCIGEINPHQYAPFTGWSPIQYTRPTLLNFDVFMGTGISNTVKPLSEREL